ncbi:MAG: hypothetical protein AAGA80_10735 [Cyanobacteria bacterium P01_F01_bin.143]
MGGVDELRTLLIFASFLIFAIAKILAIANIPINQTHHLCHSSQCYYYRCIWSIRHLNRGLIS